MSFSHPSAPQNSFGRNPDPMSAERQRRADAYLDAREYGTDPFAPARELFQWQVFTQDVLHYRTFDSLPQDEQDIIRRRRLRNFQRSSIPWVLSDIGALLTTLDDVDDLGKSYDFLKRYVFKPVGKLFVPAARRGAGGAGDALDDYRSGCERAPSGRDAKLALLRSRFAEIAAFLGLQGLKLLFPAWRFAALALQFLQTTDAMFGIGIQLGPILGAAEEVLFRGLGDLGLPFGPDHNKYQQIKGARVTQRYNKLLAAHQHMSPDDVLSTVVGGHAASQPEIMSPIVISPDDYPDFIGTLLHPWQTGEFLTNVARLGGSIPYNLAAYALNDLMLPMLDNWSRAINGPAEPGPPRPHGRPTNPRLAYMRLAEKGICPGNLCDAEVYQDVSVLAGQDTRIDFATGLARDLYATARDMGWDLITPVRQLVETILP